MKKEPESEDKDEERKNSDKSEPAEGTDRSSEKPRLVLDANGNIVFSKNIKSKKQKEKEKTKEKEKEKASVGESQNPSENLGNENSDKMSNLQKTPNIQISFSNENNLKSEEHKENDNSLIKINVEPLDSSLLNASCIDAFERI